MYQKYSKGKGEGKVSTTTGHEGPDWEKRYSPTLSLTSAALLPGSTRYMYGRVDGPQGWSEYSGEGGMYNYHCV